MKFDINYSHINYYFNLRSKTLKTNILLQKAENLPKYHKNWKSFKKAFYSQRHFNFTFIDRFYEGYHIHIDVNYAFKHFQKNTYNEPREKLNATLLPTLIRPFLVVKENNKDGIKLIFYKPFKKENNLLNIVSLSIEKNYNNIFEYKTLYEVDNLKKISLFFQKPLSSIIYLQI